MIICVVSVCELTNARMLEEFIIDMTDIFSSIDKTVSNIHPFFIIVTIKQEMIVKLCILSAYIKGTVNYFCIIWCSLPTILLLSEPIINKNE